MNYIKDGLNNVWLPYTQMQMAPDQLEVDYTLGSKIFLKDGSVLIDAIASWWSVAHGYNNPKIVNAIKNQADKLPHIMMAGLANDETYKLAYNLAKITPNGLNKVFFSDSGSTAVEVAMKMAVQYFINQNNFEKTKFLSFCNSYHGDTMGCMSLADLSGGMHKKFKKYLPKNYSVELPLNKADLGKFEDFLIVNQKDIAGVVIEPMVQCAGGMKFHSAEMLREIFILTKKYGLLFIADECAVGFYRLGKFFACDFAKITPDILVVGKAMTGGFLTMAATIATDEVYNSFLSDSLDNALMHGPTFMGNPLAASAANASIELFLSDDYEHKVKNIETTLTSELLPLSKYRNVKNVRVLGAIGVVQMVNVKSDEMFEMRQFFANQGIWLRPFADVIYIMPSLNISSADLVAIVKSIDSYLGSKNSPSA